MDCHLLVPDLFWPAAAGSEPYLGLELPALETALARGRRVRTGGASAERWLAAAYGLPAELPLAPYSLRGDGIEPGAECWMRADPVHLRILGDHLVLEDASRLAVTVEEARQFVEALNAHFGGDEMAFVAPHPQRWYARTAEEPRLRTVPTAELAGRSVDAHLPAGDEGARWRKTLTEAQMLLHEHPSNRAREARGELPVNGIWFWGAGRARHLAAPYDTSWSLHPLAAGLSAASGAESRPLPPSAAALLREPRGSRQLVVLASLSAAAGGELNAWHESVSELERAWFAPLLGGFKGGPLQSLAVHGLGADYGYRVDLTRRERSRFWRRRRPLHAYAAWT